MAYSVLQSAGGVNTVNTLTCTVTYTTANVQAGTKLIAALSISNNVATTVTSVQDAALNSMTQVGYLDDNTNLIKVALYAMDTPAGDVGIKPAIKVTVSNTADISMVVQEVSGLATGNTLAAMIDGGAAAASNSGAGAATMNSGAYSSTASGEYLIAMFGDNGGPEVIAKPWGTLDTNSQNNLSTANCLIAWKDSSNAAEGGASTQWSETSGTQTGWATLLTAFKLAAVAAGVTWTPPRTGQAAPAPWPQQRPYRSIPGALDTPANPLVSPLDSAWQADAAYHHLYNDSHLRDRRQYFYQRSLVSDPNLLQPAGSADPLLLAGGDTGDTWRRYNLSALIDRREVPQQRLYVSDPSFYPPQNNIDPLLAGQDYLDSHQHQAATHYDRREVPQQRPYISDPSFYPSAPVQAGVGAGTTEAWWGIDPAPWQIGQRAYYDTTLLATAQLENELLGGAQTWLHYVTADWYDRREVPQQRAYISVPGAVDTPANPADPTLSAWLPLWTAYNEPAIWRPGSWPQQRPYISDPSFYPTGPATDPLTLAWGAGGPYWHLYNRAGDITDRREYPAQRLYQSDPLLLTTALLENELLGGAETFKRALWWRPGSWPQQRPYISDPSFYPSGAVTDPLTVAWGAGGNYWHLYNRAADATDRREVPAQRAYVSDPLLLTTALLENELLGGAQTWMHYVTAAYADRREVPQQRPYGYDPNLLLGPVDPTQSAWAALWLAYNLAATHTDRRLYPQQRLYWPVPLPPPPFTIGLLTAGTASASTLTAADAALASGTTTTGP